MTTTLRNRPARTPTALAAALRPRPAALTRLEAAALAAATVIALAVPLAAALDLDWPGRASLAVASTVTVPGVPLALLLRGRVPMVTATIAIAASLAAHLLTATVLVTGRIDLAAAPAILAAAHLTITAALLAGGVTLTAPPRTPYDRARRAAALAALAAAGLLWWWETRAVDLDAAASLGLIGVVTWRYVLALALIAAVLVTALTAPRLDRIVLTLALAALVTCTYLLVNTADGAAGFSTGWVHVGFIDVITATGTTADGIDARFSWPGFFALAAAVVTAAGLDDAAPLLAAAPLVCNLLILPALYLIGRTVTASARLAWTGIAVYFLCNWFHQDYFAPQAAVTILYASIIGLILWHLHRSPPPRPTRRGPAGWLQASRGAPGRLPGTGARTSIGLELLLIGLTAAMIVSHQLTPVVLVIALAGLTACGAIRHRAAWLIAAVMFVAWFSYAATDFWVGHLAVVLGDMGAVAQTVSAGVTDRIGTDAAYQAMQRFRMAWTALYGLLAAAGLAVLIRRRRRFTPVYGGLVAAPFLLVALQSYGGEVFLRCFVYAAPFLAPLAAVAAAAPLARRARRPLAATGLLAAATAAVCAAALALTATRGLNVSFERVTAAQVDAARTVLAEAEPGDRVAQFGALGPLGAARVTDLERDGALLFACADPDGPGGEPPGAQTVTLAAACVLADPPEWIYVTATQRNGARLDGGMDPDWAQDLLDALAASDRYTALVAHPDVTVLRLEPAEENPT